MCQWKVKIKKCRVLFLLVLTHSISWRIRISSTSVCTAAIWQFFTSIHMTSTPIVPTLSTEFKCYKGLSTSCCDTFFYCCYAFFKQSRSSIFSFVWKATNVLNWINFVCTFTDWIGSWWSMIRTTIPPRVLAIFCKPRVISTTRKWYKCWINKIWSRTIGVTPCTTICSIVLKAMDLMEE